MIIYGALLIPVIIAVILYRYFKKEIVAWELFTPMVVSFVMIVFMKLLIDKAHVQSTEYWGSLVTRADYEEEWDEWITQTCSTTNCDGEGKNCVTTSYDCSYRQYHPPKWYITTSLGERISVSKSEYERIVKRLGNTNFLDFNRDYYRIDGDGYYSMYTGDSATAVPVTTTRTYENRIKKADQSVFHFRQVSGEDITRYQLKGYPPIYDGYKMDAVLGDSSADAQRANEKIQYLNGLLGHKKQVRCFVLIFKNQPVDAALYQEWLWSGGNMNELVVCIGTGKDTMVSWCKVISWTPNEQLKVEIQRYVESQLKLNLTKVAEYLQQSIDKDFIRRDFKEFNYLTVEPPLWGIITAYLVTLLINILIARWTITNEHKEYSYRYK